MSKKSNIIKAPGRDPETQYNGHQCCMDLSNSETLHDYSALTNISNEAGFLKDYRNGPFLKQKFALLYKVENTTFAALESLCFQCPVSCAVNFSAPCVYEADFAKGHAFSLFLDPTKQFCPQCGLAFKGKSGEPQRKIRISDVRFKEQPARIVLTKDTLRCPSCRSRFLTMPVKNLQDDCSYGLSLRLWKALANEHILGVTKRLSAQGYGLAESTIRKHSAAIAKRAQTVQIQKDSQDIRAMSDARKNPPSPETLDKKALRSTKGTIGNKPTINLISYEYSPLTLKETPVLCAIYGEEATILKHWMSGDFMPRMSETLSNDALTVLAYRLTAEDALTEADHILSYLAAEVIIAYAWTLQNRPHIVPQFDFSSFDGLYRSYLNGIRQRDDAVIHAAYFSEDTYLFARTAKNEGAWKLSEALYKLARWMKAIAQNADVLSTALREFSPREIPDDVHREAELAIQELSLATEHFHGTFEELLQEIFIFNPAVVPLYVNANNTTEFLFTEDGFLDTSVFPMAGIPIHCLRHLLREGLTNENRTKPYSCSPQRWAKDWNNGVDPCAGYSCPWILDDIFN